MTDYPPPLDSGRHPFELFVLFLGMVSGAPLLFGAPAPGTTTELLGTGLARVWGWILVGGCLVALIGVWWTWWAWLGRLWRRVHPAERDGLLIEQVGLVAVAVGTLIYAIGVVLADIPEDDDPLARVIPAALVGSLGLACAWRVWQIQRWVRAAIQLEHR